MELNEILDVVNQDRSEAEIDEARAKRRTAVLLVRASWLRSGRRLPKKAARPARERAETWRERAMSPTVLNLMGAAWTAK